VIVVSTDAAAVIATDVGSELRELLDTAEGGQGRMSLATETLFPGHHTQPHWHAQVEEIYYILQGEGRMEIGSEACAVRAGDAILIPLHRMHCLHNTGAGPLVLLCPCSPPWTALDYRTDPTPV
jgi:mannose-6-phosphate isomerase-like protein (cupin superfamily)